MNMVTRRILTEAEAVIDNTHVVYTSPDKHDNEMHGAVYVNKDAVFPHTHMVKDIGCEIAQEVKDWGVEVVISPVGAWALSQSTADALNLIYSYEVLSTYAEKEVELVPDLKYRGKDCFVETGKLVIQRGYEDLITGRRTLLVEDNTSTGRTLRLMGQAVTLVGGEIVGAIAMVNRGKVTKEDVGVEKFVSLVDIPLESWEKSKCHLCRQKVPFNTKVGKGRQFLTKS